MGFSISWIGFKALNKTEAIRRAGFRDTGSQDEANEAPYSAAALPTGWTILFSNDFDYGSAEHLLVLSLGTMVVACQTEEHIMYGAAHCSLDGREVWSVWHDSERGIYDLSTRGALPAELESIRKRLTAKQKESGGAESIVDYIYDTPVEFLYAMTGYRHDRSTFDWGQPHFTALERAR
jgi:hypothetical protein